jgi:hypothetical protein
MLSKAIEILEEEITALKDRTAREIKDIYACLSKPGAKSKLRPRIAQHQGYRTFAIIWQRLDYYNHATRRATLKAIRKGPSCQTPKSRLLSRCRNCASWEREYIWEKEQWFAGVRRKVSLLSQGVSALKQYSAMEPAAPPPALGSADVCMGIDELVELLTGAFKSLKERARREVAEAVSRLSDAVRTGLRPRVGTGKGSGFTVEWMKPDGFNPETGLAVERQISREGKYTIRRARLLAHCRGCENEIREYVWEKELEFARVRKQVDLLSQAITALKQYAKEAENG